MKIKCEKNLLTVEPIIDGVWMKEMRANKWLDNHNINYTSPNTRCIFGLEDNKIVSILVFEKIRIPWPENNFHFQIHAAWTHQQYRRRGFYTILFEELIKIGKEEKISSIQSGFDKKNKISENMQRKQKRIFYEFNDKCVGTVYPICDPYPAVLALD